MSMNAAGLEAFVLHRRAVGETSMQVIFLTREKGLLRARFRGGRKQVKQAMLEPFVPLWICVDERSSFYYIREAQIHTWWEPVPDFAVIPGLYLNELLYRFLHPEEEDSYLFSLYETTVRSLIHVQSPQDMEVILRQFEWRFLEILGHLVSFQREAESDRPIEGNTYYQLHPTKGFVPALSGFLGREILNIAQGAWEDKRVLNAAKKIMRCLISTALNGAPIYTRELYVGRV